MDLAEWAAIQELPLALDEAIPPTDFINLVLHALVISIGRN